MRIMIGTVVDKTESTLTVLGEYQFVLTGFHSDFSIGDSVEIRMDEGRYKAFKLP